ncbi:MAG: hypothetical protein BWY18_00560 [Candidatus Cloacimonetes bacterium ADurb.Bin211]|nr:MAG: hypothetical protein BWY18_00560 [Candidatus Cloacimonetes bacterium ADurb.Bin211]
MNIVICPVAITSNAFYPKERTNSLYIISLLFSSIPMSLSTNGFLPKYTLAGLLEIIIAHYHYVTEVIVFCLKPQLVITFKINFESRKSHP